MGQGELLWTHHPAPDDPPRPGPEATVLTGIQPQEALCSGGPGPCRGLWEGVRVQQPVFGMLLLLLLMLRLTVHPVGCAGRRSAAAWNP